MHKTKIGISVGLMGAFICFMGLFFNVTDWFFVALIGLVLWLEDNTWLRKLVIKVAIISLILLLIPYATNIVLGIIKFFKDGCEIDFVLSLKYLKTYLNSAMWSARISFYIEKIVLIIRILIFVVLGIKSLNQGHLHMKRIDKLIDKNV